MLDLLIIADDFTGALDTGVQFADAGTEVSVVTDVEYDFHWCEKDLQVLVMNTDTRHMEEKKAYDMIYKIVKRAENCGVTHIYKKTDSALRGNVGSELAAVLEAANEKVLPFLPAFPKMGRTTEQGIQYIDKIPVAKSVFGRDPFEPVTRSFVPDIIHLQSNVPVELGQNEGEVKIPKIVVYDAWKEEHLIERARKLYDQGMLGIMAGCAGFASVLPGLLGLPKEKKEKISYGSPGFLVVCGSVNPITQRQLSYAEHHGFARIRMTPRQKIEKDYWNTKEGREFLENWLLKIQDEKKCILDTNDVFEAGETLRYAEEHQIAREEVRRRITSSVGTILKFFMEKKMKNTLMLTGGDTLLGFMRSIGVSEVKPICEIMPGIVVSRFKKENHIYQVISKSGGFGGEELLVELSNLILGAGDY